MIGQEVTLTLPEAVYRQIKRAAERANRSVDELLIEAVSAVAPVIDTTSLETRTALAQMAYLNDAVLWQCARTTMPVSQRERLEASHQEQQRRTLSAEEQALLKLYQETLLVRAQAAVLLKQRGYFVADLTQFNPLE
jgi:hypothetical protein